MDERAADSSLDDSKHMDMDDPEDSDELPID